MHPDPRRRMHPGGAPMDPTRDLSIWSLASACRRLADIAEALSKGRQTVDVARLTEVGRLIANATEVLEGSAPIAPAPALGKRRLGGLLSRVLMGSEADAEPEKKPLGDKAPSDKHSLALRGHDSLLPTPDLVNFLSSQKKQGLLEVVTEAELFTLEFENGDIVHAQSNRTPEGQRLGDILVARGAIDRATLEQLLQTTPSRRLGETLITMQLITQEQFLEALRLQIHWLFQRLFEQPATRFSFWSGPPLYADSNVRLNATALLLDGARAFDETNWTAKGSSEEPQPSSSTVLGPTSDDWMNAAGS